jgi:hypothetical protein
VVPGPRLAQTPTGWDHLVGDHSRSILKLERRLIAQTVLIWSDGALEVHALANSVIEPAVDARPPEQDCRSFTVVIEFSHRGGLGTGWSLSASIGSATCLTIFDLSPNESA